MQKCVASAPNAEITGQALIALETSILNTDYVHILRKYGLEQIDPSQWYPQQSVLNVHREILAQGANGSTIEVSIGMKIVDSLPFPPQTSLEQALQIFSGLHIQVHRNISDEDRFDVKKVDERHFLITNNSPFPDELVYGYVYAMMRRFCPAGSTPVLRYQDPLMVNKDIAMTYDLTW